MSDIHADEGMQRMQRELELIPQVQQAMMQANRGLEMLIAVGGLSPAEVQFAQEAQLAIWQRAMVLEGIARGREIALAQSRPAQQTDADAQVDVPEEDDTATAVDDAPVVMTEEA